MSYHRERCRQKKRYVSPGEAREVLRDLGQRKPRKAFGLAVYRCPFGSDGDHWHLGHPPSVETLEQIAAEIRGIGVEGG